jgi:hypothetical protein
MPRKAAAEAGSIRQRRQRYQVRVRAGLDPRPHLYPVFGDLPVGRVSAEMLEEFYAELRQAAAVAATVNLPSTTGWSTRTNAGLSNRSIAWRLLRELAAAASPRRLRHPTTRPSPLRSAADSVTCR